MAFFVTSPSYQRSSQHQPPNLLCSSRKQWHCAGLQCSSGCRNIIYDHYSTPTERTTCRCGYTGKCPGDVLMTLPGMQVHLCNRCPVPHQYAIIDWNTQLSRANFG